MSNAESPISRKRLSPFEITLVVVVLLLVVLVIVVAMEHWTFMLILVANIISLPWDDVSEKVWKDEMIFSCFNGSFTKYLMNQIEMLQKPYFPSINTFIISVTDGDSCKGLLQMCLNALKLRVEQRNPQNLF